MASLAPLTLSASRSVGVIQNVVGSGLLRPGTDLPPDMCVGEKKAPKMEPWEIETDTKTCGPLVLTHTHMMKTETSNLEMHRYWAPAVQEGRPLSLLRFLKSRLHTPDVEGVSLLEWIGHRKSSFMFFKICPKKCNFQELRK